MTGASQPTARSQVAHWALKRGVTIRGDVSDLPAASAQRLARGVHIESLDGADDDARRRRLTSKALLDLGGGDAVEAVRMATTPNHPSSADRTTVCVSTQAGCAMACVFCATGQRVSRRNLTPCEIVAQVLHFSLSAASRTSCSWAWASRSRTPAATLAAIRWLVDTRRPRMRARGITVSTVGLRRASSGWLPRGCRSASRSRCTLPTTRYAANSSPPQPARRFPRLGGDTLSISFSDYIFRLVLPTSFASFWGAFGHLMGGKFFMGVYNPDQVPAGLDPLARALQGLWPILWVNEKPFIPYTSWLYPLLEIAVLVSLAGWVRRKLRGPAGTLPPAVVSARWVVEIHAIFVFAALLNFNATYFQGQGRYLLPALGFLSLALTGGWLAWAPRRERLHGGVVLGGMWRWRCTRFSGCWDRHSGPADGKLFFKGGPTLCRQPTFRWRRKTVAEQCVPAALALSVLIPAFNERDTIEKALARVRELGPEVEIVVVDDASTDGTREILEAYPGIVLVRHPVNQGKGMAIRTALEHATGDVVAIQDADLEYDPQDLPRLVEPIARGEARVVYGSRFLRGRPRMELPNYICNRLLAWTANLLFGRA